MTPGTAAPEPISPELVLVAPPELARLAREQLPDPSTPFWIATRGVDAPPEQPRERPKPPPYRWAVVEDEPLDPAPTKRSSARRALALAAGALLVAVTLAFATSGAEDRANHAENPAARARQAALPIDASAFATISAKSRSPASPARRRHASR